MGAVKNRIHKLLAVLLGVCLLLSYNPAFGAVDEAFAANDGGTHLQPGATQEDLNAGVEEGGVRDYEGPADETFNEKNEMTTTITAGTFDGRLQTNRRDSFSATVNELRNGVSNGTDVSYLWYEVTGGMPYTSGDPYRAEWQVFADNEYSKAITDWLTNPSNKAIEQKMNGDVANYHLKLQELAKAGLLYNNHKYVFAGTFSDDANAGATVRITLYTTNYRLNFKPDIIDGEGDLKGVQIEGMINQNPRPELTGGEVPSSSPIKEAMEEQAAKDTIEGDDGNYVVKDVLQIGTEPERIDGGDGLEILPYDEEGFILRLPLDPDYVYNDPDNRDGYKEGDKVKVLWGVDDDDKIVTIEGTVVPDPKNPGEYRVEIPYPYSGDADGDGVDDTGRPPLPGYFAIQYDTHKLPGGGNDADKAGYFSIEAKAEGNGIVTPAGTKYWRVNTGTPSGSSLDQAIYAFAPMGNGAQAYELTKLELRNVTLDRYYNLMDAHDRTLVGATLTELNTSLTLANKSNAFQANTKWTLTATFGYSSMTDDDAKKTHSLTVTAKEKDGTTNTDFGGVMVSYYGEDRMLTSKPASTNGNMVTAGSVTVDKMLNSSNAIINIVPRAPKDGKFYEVTGITMKVGTGEPQLQALEKPFVVPATTENVEVIVMFDEYSTSPDWGERTAYKVQARVDAESAGLGTVSPASVEYNENSPAVPTLTFTGADDAKYLSAVDVYVGDNGAVNHLVLNKEAAKMYSLILQNYHANLTVVGHFTDKNAPSIHLEIVVNTEGEEATAGGGYSTLAWTMPSSGMVCSGQKYPLLITPNDGYVLAQVTEKVGDANPVPHTTEVTGGVWNYVPYDERAEAQDPLDIRLNITFKKATNSGGLGDNADKKLSQVNMYVADASLASSESDLGYMFAPENGKFTIIGGNDTEAAATALSVQGYEAKQGAVNGQPSLFSTVKYGGSYPMNLVGSTVGDAEYSLQKVLVVSYYYGIDDNGSRVKKGLSWKLYRTTTPVFLLENVTTHTDVIAYFAPVGDGTNGTVTPNGFEDPKDYCKVNVSSTPQGMAQPAGTTKVLKGSSFPVTFKVSTPEYTLTSATVNGKSEPITGALKAADTSSATYSVPNIVSDTNVAASYDQKPEGEVTRHKVSADIYVKADAEAEAEPLGSGTMPCSIRVSNGPGTSVSLKNGEALGVGLIEGSDVDFSMSTRTTYQLNELGFTWEDSNVRAYRTTKTLESGVVVNGICFTTDDSDLIGRQEYHSGDPLYVKGTTPSNVSAKSWMVNNLVCNVALVSTFERISNADIPDYGDYWALTTKVGSGFGQILVNDADANGCITKVKKEPNGLIDEPIKVDFVPAEGYRIKNLEVTASTGNVIEDFWSKVQNFLTWWQVESTEQHLKDEAMASKSITLLRMRTNYDIVVDFEPIPGADTPATQLPNHVATNVLYDREKGTVVPNTGLVVNRDAEQQFVVTPNSAAVDDDGNEKYYSVVAVRVSVGDDVPEEVSPLDEDSDLVKWDPDFSPNVFVVDYSKLAWPTDQPDAAVTIEVVFSDKPTTDPDETDPDKVPGTPSGDQVKTVVVNVVTEGVTSTDDNGIGGLVSPRGEFKLIPPTGTQTTSDAYKQRVDVIPAADYELAEIEVSLGDDDDVDGWYPAKEMYERSLLEGKGYFEVIADKPGIEMITVHFRLKPLSERSYTISMEADVPDADRFIQPHGVVSLENTKSQSYSIDPDLGYWVKSITDKMVNAKGEDEDLPEGYEGANWTRQGDDEQAINQVTVEPIRLNGKAINRHVVVEFEAKEGVDHGIVKSEKVDLHVKAYGPGSEYVEFDPAGDMLGVFKGTDTKKVSYTYTYTMSPEGIAAGYGIYRVQANGETIFGSADKSTDFAETGSHTFTTDNMRTGSSNNLYVYVKKDPNFGNGGTGDDNPNNPGNDPNNPGNDPNNPGNDPENPDKNPGHDQTKYVTVDYSCGNGGSIVDKNPSLRMARAGNGGAGGTLSGSLRVNPEEPFVLMITPDEGNVVDKIIMDNCYIIEPHWMAPEDSRTAKIALESTMMVADPNASARVMATFKRGDADTFEPWDAMQDDGHVYTVDGSLIVELAPADGVEALVTVEGGTAKAADMLEVSNPVAPFTPTTSKKSAASDSVARYEVAYSTVSKLGEENNVSIVVGPLIKWNAADNASSTLYTVDNVNGLKDVTITEVPLSGAAEYKPEENDKPAYYSYYRIQGTVDEASTRNVADAAEGSDVAELAASKPTPVVRIGLRGVNFDEGVYPDYMALTPPDQTTAGTVQLSVSVSAGQGTIVPTTTTVGTSWYDGNLTGPWTVAKGTPVSFKVEPASGYVLTALSYNSMSALDNQAYDANTATLTFTTTNSTTVVAEFKPKDSADAMRTVTIEVQADQNGETHGTTSPAPGSHPVEKGQPYSITFRADSGYVPYRIWVDGQESFVAPTLGGWMLPAWWHDQTFKVEFARVGTTPSGLDYLVQTGQNVANQAGTSLVRTGDNPWLPVIVLLLLVAGGAAFAGTRMMRASETAGRAAKYSVTRREVPRRREEAENEVSESETSDEE